MVIKVKVKKITKLGESKEDCKEPSFSDDMMPTIRMGKVTELVDPNSEL